MTSLSSKSGDDSVVISSRLDTVTSKGVLKMWSVEENVTWHSKATDHRPLTIEAREQLSCTFRFEEGGCKIFCVRCGVHVFSFRRIVNIIVVCEVEAFIVCHVAIKLRFDNVINVFRHLSCEINDDFIISVVHLDVYYPNFGKVFGVLGKVMRLKSHDRMMRI